VTIRDLALVFAISATAAGAVTFLLADPRNPQVCLFRGYATEGSRFGVDVGEPGPEATAKLLVLDGVTFAERKMGGKCVFRSFPADNEVLVFHDWSWRKGAICLVMKDDRVSGTSSWYPHFHRGCALRSDV
jgi:hypothetical protein